MVDAYGTQSAAGCSYILPAGGGWPWRATNWGAEPPPLFKYVTGRLIKGSPEMLSNESLAASDQSSPNSPYRA
ncbi:MAG: hypothetical protein VX007_00430, partial [Pseudomonadota bacterium]|nr:hypothetical protein [Pseudomonadota bacterium]